jgi:DNA polymerase III sliding clamp (beta) subunit (PCNA family)
MIQVDRKRLVEVLALMKPLVSKEHRHVLRHALISVGHLNTIRVCATNLETSIVASLETTPRTVATGVTRTEFLVEIDRLLGVLKRSDAETIAMAPLADGEVVFRFGEADTNFSLTAHVPVEDFPHLPYYGWGELATKNSILLDVLHKALRLVKPAAQESKGERAKFPQFCGARVFMSSGLLKIRGTDGARMASYESNHQIGDLKPQTIPNSAVSVLLTAFKPNRGKKAQVVKVYAEDRETEEAGLKVIAPGLLCFWSEPDPWLMVMTRPLNGRYPNPADVLGFETAFVFWAEPRVLLNAVEMVLSLASGSNKGVRLTIKSEAPNTLNVCHEKVVSQVAVSTAVSSTEDRTIKFHGPYFVDALKSFEGMNRVRVRVGAFVPPKEEGGRPGHEPIVVDSTELPEFVHFFAPLMDKA